MLKSVINDSRWLLSILSLFVVRLMGTSFVTNRYVVPDHRSPLSHLQRGH